MTVKALFLVWCVLVAISAGELSGRLLASVVQEELGQDAGYVELVEPGEPGPVFGFWEGLRSGPAVRRALATALDRVARFRPDVALLVAFSGLNLRLGVALRRSGIPVVYLSPPQVWAWGAGRVRVLRQAADNVVCLYPFEVPLLCRAGVDAVFVGYPLLDLLTREPAERAGVALLPGSRPSEIAFHRPLFEQAAERLDDVRWVEPRGEGLGDCARRYGIIGSARAALVVSGTAALETALLGTPQVVCYHLSPLSRLAARALVRTRFFAMPNILAGERAVPEILEPEAGQLAQELSSALAPERLEQAQDLARRLSRLLGPAGAGARIAQLVCETAR
ncbi:hypothetical protein FJY71_05685, partial [candidate division WOR-3 bacterium]|nr:hypothetical protein [candidate division WOR-3 bacterium]